MKRIFKFCAIFLGTFFTSGLVSCSDDDDNNNNACCSYSYVSEGNTYLYTYCPDGTYTYSINGDQVFTGNWDDGTTTWEEIQELNGCN
mgnify:CR=1 FL=1|jgi:hypothetical protein|tara:strand:+ start:314 stop:577 length:264 start_codon:yes stop_codon:yes gene_type:complete